jgi:hypothetical protein
MKKIFAIFGFIILSTSLQAQISVLKANGQQVTEGEIITYNTTAYPQASFDFHIHNAASTPTLIKIKSMSITNSDGSALELCIGPVCLSSIHTGNSYPSNPVTVAANSTETNANHIYNLDTGDGVNYPIDYVFKVYQLDTSGNEVGNSVTFTYRYTTTLSVNTVESLDTLGVTLTSTLVNHTLDFSSSSNGTVTLFDMNGRSLVQEVYKQGANTISLDTITSGVYVLQLNSSDNKSASVKIVKK